MNESDYWRVVSGPALNQGDLLHGCLVPVFDTVKLSGEVVEVPLDQADLLVATQSCDLEQGKSPFVVLVRVTTMRVFGNATPEMTGTQWNQVVQRRIEYLLMLRSPELPELGTDSLVVDFRQVVTLPIGWVENHAASLGNRWRLKSPYLEDFSQVFGNYFARVALPAPIPRFKKDDFR